MLRAARLLTRQRPRKAQSRSQHLLVLLRHGQSEWNASKRFTGWVDVDLTEQGREEATHAGIMLKRHGFEFDEAHTSLLKRAVRTLWSALHCCDQHWIPVRRSWRLNERHYGALTGMSKQEVKDQMVCLGAENVIRPRRWRLRERFYATRRGDGVFMRERPRVTASFHAGRGTAPKVPERLRQETDRHAAGPPLLDGAGSALSTFGSQRLAHGGIAADVPGKGPAVLGR